MKLPLKAGLRIGIFGGTFDPPHLGHLKIAEVAHRQLRLSMIYFVPAYIPPHKRRTRSTPARHRLAMLRRAIRAHGFCRVSDIELRRKGVSYTVDTLRTLGRKYRRADLFLILGSDNFNQFSSWKRPHEIAKLATPVVYSRGPRYRRRRTRSDAGKAIWLRGNRIDISSSALRERIAQGKSVRSYVPRVVSTYIAAHNLYR